MRENCDHLLENQAAGSNAAPNGHPVEVEEVLKSVSSRLKWLEAAINTSTSANQLATESTAALRLAVVSGISVAM